MLQTGDGGRCGGFLRLQLRRIENGYQIADLHRRAFVDEQFLDAALDLRADDHLIRIDCSDQHQILGMVGGEKIVDRRDDKDDPEKNEEAVTSTHLGTPDLRDDVTRDLVRKSAAEIKSRTATRRSAIRSGVSGLKRTIRCITGALLK